MPLKDKTAQSTEAAFQQIFEKAGKPRKIITDKVMLFYVCLCLVFIEHIFFSGGEFFSKTHNLFTQLGIKHYYTNDVTQKVSPTERMILTVKTKLFKILESEKSKTWFDKLEYVQDSINHSVNRDIKMTPYDALKKENEYKVFHATVEVPTAKALSKRKPAKYNVNDVVRISMDRSGLSKSYVGQSWSSILYQITERLSRNGIWMFKVKDLLTDEPLAGSFYTEELQLVNIDLSKLPKGVEYTHARVNDNVTEIYAKLPGKQKWSWIEVEKLYPYKQTDESS